MTETWSWYVVLVGLGTFVLALALIVGFSCLDMWHKRWAERAAFIETMEQWIAEGRADHIPKSQWARYRKLKGLPEPKEPT